MAKVLPFDEKCQNVIAETKKIGSMADFKKSAAHLFKRIPYDILLNPVARPCLFYKMIPKPYRYSSN